MKITSILLVTAMIVTAMEHTLSEYLLVEVNDAEQRGMSFLSYYT